MGWIMADITILTGIKNAAPSIGPVPKFKTPLLGVSVVQGSYLVLDASLSESHSFGSTVTRYPVEDGSLISDHTQLEPIELSMEGIVTNASLDPLYQRLYSGTSRMHEAMRALLEIRQKRDVVTINTGLAVYDMMVLTNITFPRDPQTGESLRFNSTWTQIKKVTPGTKTANIDPNYSDIAGGVSTLGTQNTGAI
jgi:hypothetical protein